MERTIERLWIRASKGATPEERPSLDLVEGRGVKDDHKFDGRRHVTLLFADSWAAAEAELGRSVDPSGRRANVLLSGGDPASLVDRTVELGEVRLVIHGVTTPCALMEQAAVGLEKALEPESRGGVWGRIEKGGTIRPGDTLRVVE